MKICIVLLAIPVLIALPGCSPGGVSDPGKTKQTTPQASGIDLSPTVRKNLGVTFAKVEARRVAGTIRIPGAFEFTPLARREYRLPLAGRVELLVDQNDQIEEGQLLYRFKSPVWPELLHEIILGEQEIARSSAQIDVAVAKVAQARVNLGVSRTRLAALAEAELQRADLVAAAAEIEASLPRLEAELQLARTSLVNAERTRQHALHRAANAAGIEEEVLIAQTVVGESRVPGYTTIDWIDVRAERAGVVEVLALTDGAFADAPSLVLSTVDPAALRFRAMALQADLPQLSGVAKATIVPPRSLQVSADDSVSSAVQLGLEAHPSERTLVVFATPDRLAPWIRSGVSAFLEIVLRESDAAALAIPRSAIVLDGLKHVFFRRDPKNPDKVLRVEADMGVCDGRWTVLHSGVQRGDEVVLAGVYELNLASSNKPSVPIGSHVHADGSIHSDH